MKRADLKDIFSLDNLNPTAVAKGKKKAARSADAFPDPLGPLPTKPVKLPIETSFEEEFKGIKQVADDEEPKPSWMVQTRLKDEDRLMRAVNPDYIAVLVFNHYADATKFFQLVDEPVYGACYLDGYAVARRMGLDLPTTPMLPPNVNILDIWDDLSLPVVPVPDAAADAKAKEKAAKGKRKTKA